ncbi:MORN repeat-containing protein 1-like [Plakobranchus ocellatus]|uniref:MORN repeat-containing protein 1-like n=1 Tax=Plakobranchus ocellatus TaxID=259542 RepID=A0AAV3XYM3_9GAST|nr:MORN repeat-containing protein 1-like [Plakobranchus ocellatus]
MAATTDGNRREPYVGEKRKFLRDGYGTYIYENAFFRYEGEWMKGKKHGHGKLLMKDGTYYEGQFINGEINGNGYKYFSSSKAKYTGQFLNGEMHGHGIMAYFNGNVYEGQWYKNKKQGFGILSTSEKAVYEGTFHGHVRDGEGTQTYDESYKKLSNGDRYEGYWMLDQRNGHGDLWCADGSHYSGNFVNDMFHGAGVMTHASGIVYRGDWINGFPITMATKIVILDITESPVIIRQGQPFSIRVECRNDEDELVEDQGRELQVMAGFKYRVPKQGSALFDMIEDVEETPIPTPFGYDVVPYPLTDQLGEVSVPVTEDDSKMSTMVKDDEAEDKGEEENEEDGQEESTEGATVTGKDVTDDLEAVAANMAALSSANVDEYSDAAASGAGVSAGGGGGLGMDGENLGQEGSRPPTPGDSAAEDVADTPGEKPEEVTHLPPPMCSKPTMHGVCEWGNLQLAPAPPMYRPFVIMEEEAGPKKKSKAAQIREKIERKNSQHPGALQKTVSEVEKPAVSDEKIARTGEYVLIVQDVTSPPFMGRRLQPAFLLLKLKKPKKIVVKKPKWDTQRHILAAMSRAGGNES